MSIRRLKARGIGRLELLAWLNELLETDYTKLEHLADGIAYCQVLDALHPGKVPLQQVLFHARSHAECERNFRVLRRAFHACDIHKEIPVQKLVDGVFQEHFEFLHWLHDYAHKTYPDAVRKYHGFARRQQIMLGGGDSRDGGDGRMSSSLSMQELDKVNMNLVPSYAASSKGASDGFLTSSRFALALDLIDPEDVPDDLTLEDLVGDALSPTPHQATAAVEPTPDGGPLEAETDPLLRFVEHSHESTLHAERLLTQLEKTMAIVLVDAVVTGDGKASKSKPRASVGGGGGAKSKPAPTKGAKPHKLPAAATADASCDPPFLAPQLSELIDVLAQELSGRAHDLKTLESDVQDLVDRVAKTTCPTPPTPQ